MRYLTLIGPIVSKVRLNSDNIFTGAHMHELHTNVQSYASEWHIDIDNWTYPAQRFYIYWILSVRLNDQPAAIRVYVATISVYESTWLVSYVINDRVTYVTCALPILKKGIIILSSQPRGYLPRTALNDISGCAYNVGLNGILEFCTREHVVHSTPAIQC